MKIQETIRYEMFVVNPVNRNVEKTAELERSMRRHGFISAYPLHVVKAEDGKLMIKAGHNRYTAAAKLGIPVKYVICEDRATIHELEKATTPWTLTDYMGSFVRAGNVHYLELKIFIEETGLRVSQGASLLRGELAGSGNGREIFKAGDFIVKTRVLADRIKSIITVARTYNVPCATNQYFIQALSKMLFVDQFSDDVFIQKIKSHPHAFGKRVTVSEYEQLIEDVYNRQNKSKVNLAFLARSTSKERQATFGRSSQYTRDAVSKLAVNSTYLPARAKARRAANE